MTRKEFHNRCINKGVCTSVAIEEALVKLLKKQTSNRIVIPDKVIFPKGWNEKNPPVVRKDCLVEYLEGCESVAVSFLDDNNHDCYIADMALVDGKVSVRIYDYYQGLFSDVDLSRIVNAKDAMRFALQFAQFDKDSVISTAAALNDRQLDLLDEFIAAARCLNEAGVSLLWNEDDNALAVINRDMMQGCDFFEEPPSGELPDNAEYLSNNISNSLDIEITPISRDLDYYYFPSKN